MCNQRSQIRGPGRMEESTTTPNPVPFELPLLPSIVSTQGRSEDKGEPGVWSKGRSALGVQQRERESVRGYTDDGRR